MKFTVDNVVAVKSKAFALRAIKAYQYLADEKHEYLMSKQFLRSATSIGANVREGIRGQSKSDFVSKMSIALKEASETEYWIELLSESKYLNEAESESIMSDCQELLRILVSIIKSAKTNTQPYKLPDR